MCCEEAIAGEDDLVPCRPLRSTRLLLQGHGQPERLGIAGKIAVRDSRTGEQTILDYLIQPLNRAKEALVSSHAK